MSFEIFFTSKLPENRKKSLAIIKYSRSISHDSGILSTGLQEYNGNEIFEVWNTDENVFYENINDFDIYKSENYLFGSRIINMNKSYENNKIKIINAYNNLFEITKKEKMEIVKIWHFIPELLQKYHNDKTNYSLLCESREIVYKSHFNDFNFPAATAIGIKGKKILIYFFAGRFSKYKAIENKRQVSSYLYPQEIFKEKPMFSRAVSFDNLGSGVRKIFISGTASIKGYKSMHSLNLKEQLNEALKNYGTFINLNNNSSNISRIYITNIKDEDKLWIQQKLEKVFGIGRFIVVKGDICRKELIIEVEGVSDEKHKI